MMSLTRAAVWLVVLLSSAYAVEVRQLDASQGDEVLRDLSESDVIAPKTPAGAQKSPLLKESLGSNPNCPPSAFPICMNGGKVNEKTCACDCPWNWANKKCDACNPKGCLNGGKIGGKKCVCQCTSGFSGQRCETGSKCLNGGSPSGSGCKCANGWSGPTCNQCKLDCRNGGKPDPKTCTCACKPPYQPPQCKTCQDPGCKHGGTWQPEECKCNCVDYLAWTGYNCNTCKNPGCVNGKFNKAQCKCQCKHDGWSGPKCDKCTRVCTGGRTLDLKSCECVEKNQVSYNPCKTGCKHGDLNSETCKCTCEPGWKGLFCDECVRDKCFNGAVHDANTCECKCVPPWTGDTCAECPTQCKHGDLKDKCGGCKCHPIPSGAWKGELCDVCEHKPCQNGGTLDSSSCTCKCRMGFSGPECATCTLSQADCKHGSVFRPNTCDCDCKDVIGDWGGRMCGKCEHRGCQNGGEVDQKTCMCRCIPRWQGRYCDTCGDEFCEAKPAEWALGQEGFTSSKSQECDWIRSLGCPGGLN